jgi:hypothetical protein
MNIEEMIYNGASEEEINEALNQIKAEKARQEAALRAAQAQVDEKEALKREGRAHLINALICYSYAFDLLEEGETWDQEDVDKAEELIKKIEGMVPLYIQLAEKYGELDKSFGIGGIDPEMFRGLF